MKHVTSAALLSLGLASLPCMATPSAAQELAGYDRFDVTASHRSMPLSASIWYPAGTYIYRAPVTKSAIWQSTDAYIGAAIAPGKHPLILLSHGSGGNMDALGWLSSQLALRGAMVLAVNHPGTTSGDSSPRRTIHLAPRAADIRALLDQVLADPDFAPYIDRDRISTVGFSLGGTTVLNLAGVRFDGDLYRDFCKTHGDVMQDCAFLKRGGVDFDQLSDDIAIDAKDPRISRFVAIEPGMTYAVDDSSLKNTDQDLLFIRLGKEHGWPAADLEATGSNLLGKLDHPAYAVFAPANHLTFLAECVPGAAELLARMDDDPVCSDPVGTDRGHIHQQIIDEISGFLDLGMSPS